MKRFTDPINTAIFRYGRDKEVPAKYFEKE